MSIINRLHFGLPAGLFGGEHIATGDHLRIGQAVGAAVAGQALVFIAGARGTGKTWSVRRALREYGDQVRVAEPLRLTRDKLHMGDIETALVRDLSDEPPRRSGEARSWQVQRVLGEASRSGRAVALLIDDAHVLHHQTLRALKRLMELSWLGKSPLLGIILAGQQDRTQAIPEVGLRTEHVRLAGLSEGNVRAVLEGLNGAGGSVLSESFIEALTRHTEARNWLDLRRLLDQALARARAGQSRTLTLQHLDGVRSGELAAAPDEQAVDGLLREQAARRAA